MMKIYNSLSREKEFFKPLVDNKVKMYVCGMTVYDYCHLGHLRMLTAFDIVTRYLRWHGYDVSYIRNITDIDDKIIKRANENKEDYRALVKRFTQAMHEDLATLGLLPPDQEPLATAYIPKMITLIEKLIDKGFAYIGENGDVFYEVRKFDQYGHLAHRDIDELESGARIEINTVKRDPLDFVLWKLAKPGEPFWSSPWGNGRPGWHIECSAMSIDLLGEVFDIHGGGKDLIFPHHENEIAQSVAATNQPFAKIWMHNGYLQINKEKMSKSLGNFLTIRDLLKNHKPEALRYFLVLSHYRSPLQYSEEAIIQANQSLERLYTALRGLPKAAAPKDTTYENTFREAMNDDFNTPIAFSILFELAHEIQRLRSIDISAAAGYGALLQKLGGVLGLLQDDPEKFLKSGDTVINSEKIEQLILKRNQARGQKNWTEADKIRKELAEMSIVLEDTADGTTTWRITK